MAGSLNKVFLLGNLTRDPELRYVPSGTAVANFTVAVNRVYKDNAGEKKEDVSFIRVVVWGKMAEVCGEYLTKGRSVLVEGRLKSRAWEGQDGQKRSALDVVATNVQFVGSRGDRSQGPGARTQASEGGADLDKGRESVESINVDQEIGGADTPF
ncbi:MAG: single-stranded DNA-binding protein [Candidatus Makaraimicrobium thalassicum]|nr:MAG: single-stranded DNA-binding protein [Candidatus Omnitrophota bacterium]